jgi:hypothetical protein
VLLCVTSIYDLPDELDEEEDEPLSTHANLNLLFELEEDPSAESDDNGDLQPALPRQLSQVSAVRVRRGKLIRLVSRIAHTFGLESPDDIGYISLNINSSGPSININPHNPNLPESIVSTLVLRQPDRIRGLLHSYAFDSHQDMYERYSRLVGVLQLELPFTQPPAGMLTGDFALSSQDVEDDDLIATSHHATRLWCEPAGTDCNFIEIEWRQ